MTLLLYALPVFLNFHLIEPLLQCRHRFLVSNLAFNVIKFMFSQCHNLFDCQLSFLLFLITFTSVLISSNALFFGGHCYK